MVTLGPCVLCAGAIMSARIPRLVLGAWDEHAGAVRSVHEWLTGFFRGAAPTEL